MLSKLCKLSLICFLFAAASCTKSSSDSEDNSGDNPGSASGDIRTSCGVVQDELKNSPGFGDGELVTVAEVVDSNVVIIQTKAGRELLQLHAMGQTSSSIARKAAINKLKSLTSGNLYLFRATSTCSVTLPGGGLGTAGQLITSAGASVSEQLITSGFVDNIQGYGSCKEELIAPCYEALLESSGKKFAGDITDFLWKPAADSQFNTGKLVIHANPCDADVVVNGEHLPNFGAGNGRCTTARAQKPGCAYGRATVQIFDESSGLPYRWPDGTDSYIVQNGCQRTEFVY
ncbi:MAG: hypothetical protein K1X83_11960 [Oligoflexia bacterium]|nr:hypothetical protein [Oligoflexia bacterium]